MFSLVFLQNMNILNFNSFSFYIALVMLLLGLFLLSITIYRSIKNRKRKNLGRNSYVDMIEKTELEDNPFQHRTNSRTMVVRTENLINQ
jgi:hypothetical protein